MDKSLQDLCRLCGDERKCSFSVFLKAEDDVVLCDAIKDCLNIDILEEDTIPTEICSLCNTFILSFLKFRDVAEKTQAFLLDLQENLEKEKVASSNERTYSIKSEESAVFECNTDTAAHTDDSFDSEDDNIPLNKVAGASASKEILHPEECNICHKHFTKERYLRLHLRLSHKIVVDSKYPCPRCTRKFMQKESYERHIRLHDDPEFSKPVPCDICGKIYSNKQTLKAHIRTIHMDDGKRKFVCEECGSVFKAVGSLKAHQVSHTGEYPYECSKCDRRFQTKTNLLIHMDIHSETPYICTICGGRSTTLRGLRVHMIKHSDRKPHQCPTCGNSYKRVTALKKHLIVHSGIKPYSCNFCERTFADGSNKRIHMKRVHKKELAEMEAKGMRLTPTKLPKLQQLKEDGMSVRG